MDNKIYAEAFRIYGSVMDVKIDFLSVDPLLNEQGQPAGDINRVQQRVALSLPIAKNLATKLMEVVEDYEKNIGPVFDMAAAEKAEK